MDTLGTFVIPIEIVSGTRATFLEYVVLLGFKSLR